MEDEEVNPPHKIVPEVSKSKLAIAKSAHEIASIIAVGTDVRFGCSRHAFGPPLFSRRGANALNMKL